MARSGWAYGDVSTAPAGKPAEWLTVLGSAYMPPELFATKGEAQFALDKSGKRNVPHLNMVVAHVTEVPHGGCSGGYAYRITER